MNARSDARLVLVHPVLASRVRQTARALLDRGIAIEVVSGFRSYTEQTKLYAQGRTSPGKPVTDARAGESFHNFGLAVDVCPWRDGAFDWNAPRAVWEQIGATAKAHRLAWGGDWKKPDLPHLEIRAGLSLARLRELRTTRTHAELLAAVCVGEKG
jgi:peptidoglycan L-alanyl-D-glutamate endopeptidase CwlK